ncbi:MAG: DUF1800 domain-containing protein [Pseudoruegeria sp.]
MFDPETAAIRFGTGLSPRINAPSGIDAMLNGLSEPTMEEQAFPINSYSSYRPAIWNSLLAGKKMNKAVRDGDEVGQKKARKIYRKLGTALFDAGNADGVAELMRGTVTENGFKQRLVWFWADHFSAYQAVRPQKRLVSSYIEEAIRPNIGGSFYSLLTAASLHPVMLKFLDQDRSFGPNSKRAKQQENLGLNENLAREILELHTMGVDGAYSQKDVREFARLLTGYTYNHKHGARFLPAFAEPGPKYILNQSYAEDTSNEQAVLSFLKNLTLHPDTAHHIARKLVVHFVSDEPKPELVSHVSAAFLGSEGNLLKTYEALLEHPMSWKSPDQKIKRPLDLIVSSMRAMGINSPSEKWDTGPENRLFFNGPLTLMGQTFHNPPGPDGWPESTADWLHPQSIAARIQWTMTVPARLVSGRLPDPRDFAEIALGERLTNELKFAAKAAETRREGIGIILASPEFQRR